MQFLRNRNGKEIKGQFIELATGYYLNLVDGRKYFGELINSGYSHANDPDIGLFASSRVNDKMIATVGDDQPIATPVCKITTAGFYYLGGSGYSNGTNNFALEEYVNLTQGTGLLRTGSASTASPGYYFAENRVLIASDENIIVNDLSVDLNVLNQGWVHLFWVVDRSGYVDCYRNGVRVVHIDISSYSDESLAGIDTQLRFSPNGNVLGKIAYIRQYKFDGAVPANIADLALSNYQNRTIHETLLTSLTHNIIAIPSTNGRAILCDTVTDNSNYIVSTVITSEAVYSTYGDASWLDRGYTLIRHETEDSPYPNDVVVPLAMDGSRLSTAIASAGIVIGSDHQNVGDYENDTGYCGINGYGIVFTEDFLDRSDTDIWGADARDGYYDSDNPTFFHIKELNQRTIQEWLNDGYKGRFFIKGISETYEGDYDGSIEATHRKGLAEIMLFSANKTGTNHVDVLTYTGDIFAAVYDGDEIDYDGNNQVQLGYLQATSPMLTLRVDDGLADTYNIKSLCNTLGVTPFLVILSELIDTAGYMTWDYIRGLQSDGWEMGTHGEDDTDIRTLTQEEIAALIPRAKATINSEDITGNINFVPHRQGYRNLFARRIARQHFRTSHVGMAVAPQGCNPQIINLDNMSAMAVDLTPPAGEPNYRISTVDGMQNVKDEFDYALANNRWAIIFWHSGNYDDLNEIISYAQTNNLEIVKFNDALDRLKYKHKP